MSKKDKKKPDKVCVGEFIANERGFGFVVPEGTSGEDVFIPPESVCSAMNGDIVLFKVTKLKDSDRRAEGKVMNVLKRNVVVVIGTYYKSKNFGFVVVDDKRIISDIYISKKSSLNAKQNDKVVVEITKYPEGKKKPEGKVIEILGKSDDTAIDLLTVLRTYNYKLDFPKTVIAEARQIPQSISNIDGRVDLREREIFTIDGDDTKDIDDAISISKKGKNYILGVHIADVSNYVREGTPLDNEAVKRGTSVYLIDTVIPMLPKELSNGICSLNPNEDRYALSVDMEIDEEGRVVDRKIFKSVIKSRIQMTYDKVYKTVEGIEEFDEYKPFTKSLKLMKELALILINKKAKNGCIDFNIPEAKIILDGNGKPIEIKAREMTIANKMIEEFMIVANETIAEYFCKKEIPFIYRVHENPDEEKLQKLNVFLNNINSTYRIPEKVDAKILQEIIASITGGNQNKVVSTMVLRSMKLARYSNENIGHFGLTSEFYCHFTSPIRRYPDLFIHRIISEYLDSNLNDKKVGKYKKLTAKYADMSSDAERNSEEAERDLDEIKKCEYMAERIGEEYEGIVSSVTSFGIFIELMSTVEGLVHVDNMHDDYYEFDEVNVKLVGRKNKKTYQIGDNVKVRTLSANKILRRIDFELL